MTTVIQPFIAQFDPIHPVKSVVSSHLVDTTKPPL
jgi:hypothetical protein